MEFGFKFLRKKVFCYLSVCGFTSHSRIFHSYGYVTIAGEGLQILTYARHSWPLSSEDKGVRAASGRLGVRIPAATDLSRKKGSDSSTTTRSAISVSVTEMTICIIMGCPVSQQVWHAKEPTAPPPQLRKKGGVPFLNFYSCGIIDHHFDIVLQ